MFSLLYSTQLHCSTFYSFASLIRWKENGDEENWNRRVGNWYVKVFYFHPVLLRREWKNHFWSTLMIYEAKICELEYQLFALYFQPSHISARPIKHEVILIPNFPPTQWSNPHHATFINSTLQKHTIHPPNPNPQYHPTIFHHSIKPQPKNQ